MLKRWLSPVKAKQASLHDEEEALGSEVHIGMPLYTFATWFLTCPRHRIVDAHGSRPVIPS